MLLFIISFQDEPFAIPLFQYISCYCLSITKAEITTLFYISIHLMLLFIGGKMDLWLEILEFQYISCYCLSIPIFLKPFWQFLFQYISCYCLSASSLSCMSITSHFNTSHVTVYPVHSLPEDWEKSISIHLMLLFIIFVCIRYPLAGNFNTSHVTVYRRT